MSPSTACPSVTFLLLFVFEEEEKDKRVHLTCYVLRTEIFFFQQEGQITVSVRVNTKRKKK